MSDVDETFPLEETLDDGRYKIASNAHGFSVDRVDFATSPGEPAASFLVSSTEREVPLEETRHDLGYAVPGVFDLMFIGTLDERGDHAVDRARRRGQVAVVERLPAG